MEPEYTVNKAFKLNSVTYVIGDTVTEEVMGGLFASYLAHSRISLNAPKKFKPKFHNPGDVLRIQPIISPETSEQ